MASIVMKQYTDAADTELSLFIIECITLLKRDRGLFNQPIDAWNVERVTNMEDMFYNARAFNQPLNAWNVGRVTTMREMFIGASAFDQESLSWVIPLRCSTGYMFRKYA